MGDYQSRRRRCLLPTEIDRGAAGCTSACGGRVHGELQIRGLGVFRQLGSVLQAGIYHAREQPGHLLHIFAVEGRSARGQIWAYGRGSLRTEVHGSAGRGQAGKLRPDDRWGMRSGSSPGAGEEQEVDSELRRCVHSFYSSLQEAGGVCRVLGSGKLSAPEWSQSRNAVDVSEAFFLPCRPWTVSRLQVVRGRSAASSKAGALV